MFIRFSVLLSIFVEARDLCIPFPERGWSFGLHDPETSGEKDLRLSFSLHSWSRLRSTTLTSPLPLASEQWTQLAATFDGEVARFYQNGVQVSSVLAVFRNSALFLTMPSCMYDTKHFRSSQRHGYSKLIFSIINNLNAMVAPGMILALLAHIRFQHRDSNSILSYNNGRFNA